MRILVQTSKAIPAKGCANAGSPESEPFMGALFEAKQKIDLVIQQKGLDPAQIKGAIGLKTGILLNLLNANTPDDPAKLAKLKQAAAEVLGLQL
jgi:hypothetical protein